MQIDPKNWSPSSIAELAEIFNRIGIRWWISGGWAIDLYLGRQTRKHEDIDVQILRADQLTMQSRLNDWQLYKTNQPGLAPWPKGEYLNPPVNCIWAKRSGNSPWTFEVMFMEGTPTDWIYRRTPEIRGSLAKNSDSKPPTAYHISPRKSNSSTKPSQTTEKKTWATWRTSSPISQKRRFTGCWNLCGGHTHKATTG